MIQFSAEQVAEVLQGTVVGNPEVKVHTVAKIEEATQGALAFLANVITSYSIHYTKLYEFWATFWATTMKKLIETGISCLFIVAIGMLKF